MNYLVFLIAVVLRFSQAADDIVVISDGPIQGLVYDTHRAFLGIPYAQPPVDQLRWASPLQNSAWKPNTLNATVFSAGCPQSCHLPPHTCPREQSEDCLYLNVYTPRSVNSNSKKPVMVFLPGGRFEQGSAMCLLYDGSYFVNRSDVVLVNVNYRLGVLGWLVSGDLMGNFALEDQRLALQWVQNNIQNFGGDPNKVTLFGQSAGASSTAVHLVSKKSAGLFQSAIMMSNPFTLPMKTFDIASQLGDLFVIDLGCEIGDDDCLRSKSVQDILAAQNRSQNFIPITRPLDLFLPWTPSVDGDDIVAQPLEAFSEGLYHKMPIMIGTDLNDALLFIYQASKSHEVNIAEYLALLGYIFEESSYKVLEKYPPDAFEEDTRPLLGRLGTDYVLYCSSRNAMLSLAQYEQPVYFYRFDHILSFDPWGPDYQYCVNEVCHGSELPLMFHVGAPYFTFNSVEKKLSNTMIDYWTNFAKTGDPNSNGLVNWPSYAVSNNVTMILSDKVIAVSDVLSEYCNFWDEMGYLWGT